VKKDQIEEKTQPPVAPIANLQTPSKIFIVKLKKRSQSNLITGTYADAIFEKVELQFRRFFEVATKEKKLSLDEVHVIINPVLEERFAKMESELHSKYLGKQEFQDSKQSPLQQQFLAYLQQSESYVEGRNSNAVSAFHGASSSKLESICWYGLLNLSTLDPGMFPYKQRDSMIDSAF
jgi:hypothetical protein